MDLAKTAVPDDNQIDLLVVGITYDSGLGQTLPEMLPITTKDLADHR